MHLRVRNASISGKAAFHATSETMKGVRLTGTSDIRELKMLGDWAYTGGLGAKPCSRETR